MRMKKWCDRCVFSLGVAIVLASLLLVTVALLLSIPVVEAQSVRDITALEIDKQVSTEVASPGDRLTYTIQVQETSEPVSITLTDELPPGVQYVENSLEYFGPGNDPQYANGEVTWQDTDFGYNEKAIITFSVVISPEVSGGIQNVVEITGTGQLVTDAVETRLVTPKLYLPIMFRWWPPIPKAPTLNDIDNADIDRNYEVSWTYDPADPEVLTYTLQEDTHPDFLNPTEYVYPGDQTSVQFTDKTPHRYYYRVRGHNGYGIGAWSNVESVMAGFYYFDDFSDEQSGWPREWSRTRGALYQIDPVEYPNCPGPRCAIDESAHGYVIARRAQDPPYARFGPGVAIPTENYRMELDARWWEAAYYATYEIMFGANSSFTEYYAVKTRIADSISPPICSFKIIRVDGSGEHTVRGWDYDPAQHCGKSSNNPNEPWNHWVIERQNGHIRVYVNGKNVANAYDATFGANRYFGLGATLFEGFTPSKPEVDNWEIVAIQ